MVYYVIALALEGAFDVDQSGRKIRHIVSARMQLGEDAVRRLHDANVRPIATPTTKGACFKHWRLVSLDGSTLDVADEPRRRPPSVGRAPATV
jgi:hypothetical protein